MMQDELKALVAQAAADYVLANVPKSAVLGVGTDSTANLFIDVMAPHKARFAGAVPSSEASTRHLQDHGSTVLDLNEVGAIPVYADDAGEIDASGAVIKGGGDTLTHKKIVAPVAKVFTCIVGGSKFVETTGAFLLSVEVMPMIHVTVARQPTALGGQPRLRATKEDQIYKIDNGNVIIDVVGPHIADPKGLESAVNEIPGMVTVSLLAKRGTNVLLLGTGAGAQRHDF